MTLAAGTTLGPYEILSPIGAGGMGQVYRALDTRLGREVAVKVLPEKFSGDPERVARFEREAKTLAALQHPNILAIYDVGEQAGTFYVVTELLRGQSLDQRLDAGPLPFTEALGIAHQAAAGLAAAHEKGIVHRDLKPANLFVTEDGRVKVLDFGLARMLEPPLDSEAAREATTRDALTASHVIMGTVGYLSPEQARFHRGDVRSDVFAFGCVLYEMLTGHMPFHRETATDALVAVLTHEPAPPSALRPEVPPELDRTVLRCLAKDPADRFPSARELSAELESIRFPAAAQSPSPRPRGRRLGWALAALASACLIAAAILAFRPGKSPSPAALPAGSPGARVSVAAPHWKDSVAVLPFKNLSPDPEQEYFCDGMTEQVISDLTRVPDLRVIARTSVMTYKKSDKDVRQIARELGVDHVLEGSVRRAGNKIRVTAQLIKGRDGSHVWARDYDREMKDVFSVQDEVARAIASALQLTAGGGPPITAQEARPSNVEAYEFYLMGRHHAESVYMATHDEQDYRKAMEFGKRAVRIDPSYALGYIGLATTCEDYLIVTGDRSVLDQQFEYAKRAHELAPDSSLACAAYGMVLARRGRPDEGFALARRGLQLNPNESLAWLCVGAILMDLGLVEDALACHRRCVELDPLNYFAFDNLGGELVLLGRPEEAVAAYRRALELQPAEPDAMFGLAFAYLLAGTLLEAGRETSKVDGLEGRGEATTVLRALWHAARGEREDLKSRSRARLRRGRAS